MFLTWCSSNRTRLLRHIQTSVLGTKRGTDFVHSIDDERSSGYWRKVLAHSVRQGWSTLTDSILGDMNTPKSPCVNAVTYSWQKK